MKTKVEIELDIPDGYEATGEFRPWKEGEWFLNSDGNAEIGIFGSKSARLILRKLRKKLWVPKVNEGVWIMQWTTGVRKYHFTSKRELQQWCDAGRVFETEELAEGAQAAMSAALAEYRKSMGLA